MKPKHRSSIFTFTCPDPACLAAELARRDIIVAVREGSLRVSVHLFNNEHDIDRLTDCLDWFAAQNS